MILPDLKQYTPEQELEAAKEIKLCMDKDIHASLELCQMTVDYGVMRKQVRAAKVILK